MNSEKKTVMSGQKIQLTTFNVGDEVFGLEVTDVQELTGNLEVVGVPLAPQFVRGLINLRGQIATAIDLKIFFEIESKCNGDEMSVVCRVNNILISLIVDSIGDVVEIDQESFESTPDTIPFKLRKYMKGIYKFDNELISLIKLESIVNEIEPIEVI